MLTGKVLITGGAGFLARAIYRRARAEQWDVRFTCASRDDAKHAALQRRFPEVSTVVCDVGLDSVDRLADLMRGFDTVIHAAAWKYVDRAEAAARATIETNVVGSLNVAEAARRAGVSRVLGISTDKAVTPVNTYGASKMMMERIFQEADRLSETEFTVVRYGNVTGSTGSVIPIWMSDFAAGRALRITDPSMTRFWMSPDEAVDTVLAGLEAPGGTIAIPACRSMSMHDLALMVLGYDEHDALPTDGRVEVVGIRPGEKRHEALVQKQESIRATYIAEYEGRRFPIASEHALVMPENQMMSWRWLHIAPPDALATNEAPFEVTSDQPPRGWMGMAEMRAIIADAATLQ